MTTMKTTSEVASQVLQMMTDRAEVSVETVAEALASEIVTVQMDDLDTTDAVDAGVRAAIHEIDDTTFEFAVDVFRGRVLEEV